MSEIRHGSSEELLALRDGEGSAWAREHVAACAACAAELARLEQVRAQLRALPSFAPPRDRWPLVERIARQDRRRRRVSGSLGLLAAAAVVVLSFVALHHPTSAPADTALQQAMDESAAMEQVFRSLQPDQRALTGSAASVVVDLEDRLARVDAALNDPAAMRADPQRVAQLWKQRAGLLSALVDVHETRATYAGL
jgi:anti-sigma factor RsiW